MIGIYDRISYSIPSVLKITHLSLFESTIQLVNVLLVKGEVTLLQQIPKEQKE